jgi:threonine/homoserine/homoserine lactone efflux protein|tara:strand:- start:143 stop:406 length:264 start_codon:yes stop_codon:yes gene_type:complete
MLVNRLILFVARKIGISPLFAHCLLMVVVTVGFGFANPSGWHEFSDPIFLIIWFGICTFVIFVTWVSKGEYRKHWTNAAFWKENSDP